MPRVKTLLPFSCTNLYMRTDIFFLRKTKFLEILVFTVKAKMGKINDDIPVEFFGRWPELVKKVQEEAHGGRFQQNTRSNPETHDSGNRIDNDVVKDTQSHRPEQQLPKETQPVEERKSPEAELGPEPTKEGFDIPTSQEAYERMVDRLATVGLERWEVDKAIEAKTTAFNRACREHKKRVTEFKKKSDEANKKAKSSRKNSLVKQ